MPVETANYDRTLKQVLDKINASDTAAYSASLSSRNKTRNLDAIKDAGIEAGLEILRKICSTPGNEYRNAFVAAVVHTHRANLAEHIGKPVYVEIQKQSGGSWVIAERRTYQKIESWRNDPHHIYDSVAHNDAHSKLAGFYDIWNDRLYFTGAAARIGLANATRADVLTGAATRIPAMFESTWVKLWIGNLPKAGEGAMTMQMAEYYFQRGMNDLMMFEQGKRQMPEVDEPEPTSAVHV